MEKLKLLKGRGVRGNTITKFAIRKVEPDLQMHFEDDMIVLEKWKPKKPVSVIYYDGEKERYYVKRFLIETEEKEEVFISEHSKSQLEIIAVDYRPVAEVIFSKRSLDKKEINFEEFIAVKGIKAQGNQLTTDKIKQVNLLASLPFEEPEEPEVEEVEVVEEEVISTSEKTHPSTTINKDTTDEEKSASDDGQITLF